MSRRHRNLRLERYREELRADWNHAVRGARNGLFFFEREFLDYHGTRFADCSLMVYAGQKVMAVLPAHVEGDTLGSHRGLPFAGWIVAPEFCLRHMEKAFVLLEDFLRAEGLRRLRVTPVPGPYAQSICEEQQLCLRRAGAVEVGAKVAATMPVRDFQRLATDQRARLLKNRILDECRVEISSDIRLHMERVAEFLQRRHQCRPLHSAEEMERIARAFPENVRIWDVWRDDKLVGGNLVFVMPHILRSQHLYVCENAASLGGAAVVYGAILMQPQIQGHWWDFGTSMDPATGQLDSLLHQFKESHGGRTFIQSTYEWNLDS